MLKLTDLTDRIRVATETLYQELINAEATAFIGAAPFERSDERTTHRNGSRDRVLTTAAGDLDLKIPKLRAGTFFSALLERRRRIDQALFAVVMEAYLRRVSTRKVDDLVKALGADTGISKFEVSRICAGLDAEVAQCLIGLNSRGQRRWFYSVLCADHHSAGDGHRGMREVENGAPLPDKRDDQDRAQATQKPTTPPISRIIVDSERTGPAM
jgi:hypothetical protein